MSRPPRISEAEWEVMEQIWLRNPISAPDLIEALSTTSKKWAPNTIRTMLSRLVKKGVLQYESEGGRFHYRPLLERSECVQEEVNSLLGRVFGGAIQPLLLHFVKNQKLNAAQIQQLREILEQEDDSL